METNYKNFEDFWSKTRNLSKKEREKILDTLSFKERKYLVKSYKEGGWEDLEMRNIIDRFVEQIKHDINIDLFQIRVKVLSGNSVYVKKSQWNYITDIFKEYKSKHSYYAIGGISAQEVSSDTVLLLKSDKVNKY